MAKTTPTFLAELKKLAKKSQVKTDKKSLFEASYDNTKRSFLPDAVVFVKDAEEVGKILKLANKHKVPITPRGAGTGCSGGALPYFGGVVLDFSKFDKITIDPLTKTATVQSGAINWNVNEHAKKFGLFYPPDPSSTKYSTIGGNIACNAGGLRACKYGTTRDNLMSAEGYLPNGDFVKFGLPLKKFSTGYNLKDLLLCSEGTLAVITKATLKLKDLPKEKLACLSFFDSDEIAFKCIERILTSPLNPSIFEFMDAESVSAADIYEGKKVFDTKRAAILMEFEGDSIADIKKSFAILKGIAGCQNFKFAKNANESEKLWQLRRDCSQASYIYGNFKLNQDIVLAANSVAKYFKKFKATCKKEGFASPTFGHAGDGNYHLHIMCNANDPIRKQRAKELMQSFIAYCVKLGGAVSGEHGLGLLKAKYLPLQHTQAEIDAMKSLKKAFDKNNILNAGKVLGLKKLSNCEPIIGLKLPWEKR